MRLLLDLVQDVLARYGLLAGSQFAAAIAYRALFSLVPLATFVATVLAQVLSSSTVDQAKLVSSIAEQLDLSAAGATKLDALIDSVPSPWSVAGLISLGLALGGRPASCRRCRGRSLWCSTAGSRGSSSAGGS